MSSAVPRGIQGVIFDLIYLPQALQQGAQLVTGARVSRIVTNAKGLAEGAIWIDRDGHEHFQRADVVVLCANGIGTARLLLLFGQPCPARRTGEFLPDSSDAT